MVSLSCHGNRSMSNESRITDFMFTQLGFPCGEQLQLDRCFQVEVDRRAVQYFWRAATKSSG